MMDKKLLLLSDRRRFLFLIITIWLIVSTRPGYSSNETSDSQFDISDIRDYGASQQSTDNAEAIKKAMLDSHTGIIKIPKGNWRIGSCELIQLNRNTKIIGEDGARLIFETFSGRIRDGEGNLRPKHYAKGRLDFSGQFIYSKEKPNKLIKSVKRGDKVIQLQSVSGIKTGDLIYIFEKLLNNEVVETAWDTDPAHLTRITAVSPTENLVTLLDPLNFDFPAEGLQKIVVSRSEFYLDIENLILQDELSSEATLNRKNCSINGDSFESSLIFNGIERVTLKNITQENLTAANQDSRGKVIVTFSRCMDCQIVDCRIINGLYPYQLNTCRNITINRLDAINAHHPVTPAAWSDGIYIKYLKSRGGEGGVESHPAFNIHYSDVDVEDSGGYSNLRCVGASLTNARLKFNGDPNLGGSIYFHYILFSEKFKSLFDEYELRVENLIYDQNGKEFYVRSGGRLIIRDSDLKHGLRIGPEVKELYLENCKFPTFKIEQARQLKLVKTNNSIQNFVLDSNDNIYKLNLLDGKVDFTRTYLFAQGDICREKIVKKGEALDFNLRVYDHWLQRGMGYIYGVLTLIATVRHANVGIFDIREQRYHLAHKLSETSASKLARTELFKIKCLDEPSKDTELNSLIEQDSSGTGKCTLEFSSLSDDLKALELEIIEVDEKLISQSVSNKDSDPTESYFQIKVSLKSQRTSPSFGLSYKLELFH